MTTTTFNSKIGNHFQALYYFALQLTHNDDNAKDLFQDTLEKAFRYKARYVENNSMKSWLFTIMKNTFITNYRKGKRTEFIIDTPADSPTVKVKDHSFLDPERKMTYKEIKELIRRVPQEFGQPFQMILDGYKYKEISDKLNIPMGTVKSRIFAARKILMKQLSSYR